MDDNIKKEFKEDLNQLGLLVADHIDAMLAYWDKDQICRFANKSYLDWFGKNRDEMIGKITLKELLGTIYERNIPFVELALAGQAQTFEREITTPSGQIRNAIANYYPHIVNGEVYGFFVHVADITPMKNMEKELTTLLEREKQLNEIKSRFVSTASHELRTPLSAISSSVALMQRYVQSGNFEKMDKHFNRIGSSVKNLVAILNDYLSLDKIEQGKVGIEYVHFNMPFFCKDIIENIKGILKKGQRIHYIHKGDEYVYTDEKIVRNIILNLLSNSIKYSDNDKDIYLSTEVIINKISLNVRDNGIGISETDQGYLFQTFYRAENAINIEGSGLGLTIVKRYVEILGGTVDLKSNIGQGTSVHIVFPRILR